VLHNHVSNAGQRTLVLVDSGAGGTVCSTVELFLTNNPPSTPTYIQFGTGPRNAVEGIGTVSFGARCMDTGRVLDVYIRNAYYVPTQPMNILSVRDVLATGGAVIFDQGSKASHIRWKGQPSDVQQAMQWKCRLPHISCRVVSGKSIHTIRKVLPPGLGYDLTHASLGHMCSAKVKRLVPEGYIEASKLNGNDSYTCSACETANAK
jgi:hypothetical protein